MSSVFAPEDMPVARHTFKKYKKSTNRKPKDRYLKKNKLREQLIECKRRRGEGENSKDISEIKKVP